MHMDQRQSQRFPIRLRRSVSVLRPVRLFMAMPLMASVLLGGCKDLTGAQALPAGINDPSTYNTPAGASQMRNAAVKAFEEALHTYVIDAGQLTDEFTGPCSLQDVAADCLVNFVDIRNLPEIFPGGGGTGPTDIDFDQLNTTRGFANQAIHQLATYDSAAPASLRGELFALTGYSELMLADFFCSGVPLSTLDFQHDFTYKPGSTTTQVYEDAVTKFDSALALAGANDTILNLAHVGKGRALLAQGLYASAAQAVSSVPDDYRYQLAVQWVNFNDPNQNQPLNAILFSESDQEGGNGLPFVSSGDPRSADTAVKPPSGLYTLRFPLKYSTALSSGGYAPVTVADGIEARLIQAEAALQTGDATTWLSLLNHLRATASVQAGGGVAQPDSALLPQLSMPNSDTARVTLLFQERAYWLFATGHRQGDLRRLMRNYHRSPNQVYPTGVYISLRFGSYGDATNAPIPPDEFANPFFHGCIDRNA